MNSMNLIGKFISNFRDFYNEINAATLTGAIDVVVVEQQDGSYTCSPFHVRFGKLGVLRSREKIVDIEINGDPLDIHMKLGESGEAFFVEEVPEDEEDDDIPPHLACSPIPLPEHFDAWIKEEEEKERQTAKVFIAETVGEERKPSLVLADFRPIEEKKQGGVSSTEGDSESIKTETGDSGSSVSQLSTTGAVGGGGGLVGGGGGGKRKRRKKSNIKRKGSAQGSNQQSKTTFQTEINTVFNLGPTEDDNRNAQSLPSEPQRLSFNSSDEPSSLSPNDSYILQHTEEFQRLSLAANDIDYHFFSDTELTPGCRPESRPPSPVASDTEVDQRRRVDDEITQSWKWGELPSPLPRQPSTANKNLPTPEAEEAAKKQEQDEAQKSIISGMFSFMKKTKHLRQEGVYLSDLNTDDPEVAALYFPHHYRANAVTEDGEQHGEDDAESGNGPSIPVSPTSQSPPPSGEWGSSSRCECGEITMSLCGHLDSGVSDELFNQFLVSYEDFIANPMMMEHPDLVIRVGTKFYSWRTAWPIIMSQVLYKKSLPQPVIDVLSNESISSSKLKEMKDKGKPAGYSSWFGWRRSATAPEPSLDKEVAAPSLQAEMPASAPIAIPQQNNPEVQKEKELQEEKMSLVQEQEKEEGYAGSNSSEESDSTPSQSQTKIPKERRRYQLSDKCRKTLRLSSDQIKSLNLADGANEVEFSVTTAYQGTTRCKCHIYKWRFDDKIVISDIDGTITKSDVLGHVLPIVGKDWAQSGVAQLFTKIKNNGYKLLYLSSRAIGQARVTRDYLRSIKQGDLSLPDGPLLLNPTSLISAFHREVIERKPEEFKISCLRDIQALFPSDAKTFYAGYGNRVNDVWAYRAVGIPIVRIFTINYKGELKHELTQTFQSSYNSMCQLVDEMFPPAKIEEMVEDFGNFLFWREPLPDIDFTDCFATDVKT